MKIAIVCDWLVTLGGAEKLLGEMFQCFPEADLFAVIDFLPDNERGFLLNKKAQTTFIQHLPFAKKKYRHYLPLMPFAIEQLDLSAYDVILSSSHAVAKGVITGPDQLHICYIHSPMRYAWDLQHQYLRESGLDKKWQGYFARYLLHKLRIWDYRSANNVDYFIANSQFIAKRVQKTYRREATVIYPAVNLDQFVPATPGTCKDTFYFTASRFVPYKRIDLIVAAFAAMPDKKLIVLGDGPEMKKVRALATSNVTLLGFQSNEVLINHLQRAKAFIFAAEEDFGLVPLEAQACGTPVIAYGKGGALETVRGIESEAPTGFFFYEQSIRALCATVTNFEQQGYKINASDCVAQAHRFAAPLFRKQFIDFVQEKRRAL